MIRRIILVSILLNLAAGAVNAAQGIRVERVQFNQGESAAVIEGTITGNAIVDYVLGARQGQDMNVSMTTDNTANYFNVLPPGSENVAIFIGSISGDNWTGTLEASGDYKVRVYLMRSAARRNESARYVITFGITGSSAASATLEEKDSSDARVEGTPYHATGQVSCSMGDAPSGSEQCAFGVIRKGPGSAEVHVTPSSGFERVLIFIDDKVSATEGSNVKSSKSGDIWTIEVNDYEHYQIPEAVISGG